jgi:hypothetical protein
MNAYAQTSRLAGLGYRRMQSVRSDYRNAARSRQEAHQRLCNLHAQGQDIHQAKQAADAAELLFWRLDQEFRRYQAFYA